jgi:hypothetical protein
VCLGAGERLGGDADRCRGEETNGEWLFLGELRCGRWRGDVERHHDIFHGGVI